MNWLPRSVLLGFIIVLLGPMVLSPAPTPTDWCAEITLDFDATDADADRCQSYIEAVLKLTMLIDKIEKRVIKPKLAIIVTQNIHETLAALGPTVTLTEEGETEWDQYGCLVVPEPKQSTSYVLYIDYEAFGMVDLFGGLAHQWEHLHQTNTIFQSPNVEAELAIVQKTIRRLRRIGLMLNKAWEFKTNNKTLRDRLVEQIEESLIPIHQQIYRELDEEVRQQRSVRHSSIVWDPPSADPFCDARYIQLFNQAMALG